LGLEKDAEVSEIDGMAAVEGGSFGCAGRLQLDHFFEDLAGAVGGTVVYENDFLAKLGVDDAAKDFVNGGFFVVNRNNNGELGVHQGRRVATVRGHKSLRGKFSGGDQKE
jgi:hypothetical protein